MNKDMTLKIHANLSDLKRIRDYVESKVQTFQLAAPNIYDILLITTEAATNILIHGYLGQSGLIEIGVKVSAGSVYISLRDKAPYFDPNQVSAPDITLPLEKRPLGGMGIHLMRQFSDQIIYQALPQGGNELTLIKRCAIPNLNLDDSDAKYN